MTSPPRAERTPERDGRDERDERDGHARDSGPVLGEIEVAERFCGPPRSGNGGYVAGRLAAFVDSEAVAVRLRRSPPLGRRLEVLRADEGVALCEAGEPIAEARPVVLDLTPPPAPSFEEAERASRAFRGFREHVFPGCFVCGPDRAEGDGLRIFPGAASEGSPVFAAPWVPHVSLASLVPGAREGDPVPAEFVWSALDCPGAFSFPQPEGRVVLLGEMQCALSAPIALGERCVLTSWQIRVDGRKHFTGSAVHGDDGQCRGLALGLWFEVDPESVPGD